MPGVNYVLKGLLLVLVFSMHGMLLGQVPPAEPDLFSAERLPRKGIPGDEQSIPPIFSKEQIEKQQEARKKQLADSRKFQQELEAHIMFAKSFAEPNPQDGELRKLQRERLSAAISEVKAWRDRIAVGDTGMDQILDQVSEAARHLACAAMDFSDSKELIATCLQLVVSVSTLCDNITQAKYKAGQGHITTAAAARYNLRTAQIELLKFNRDNPSKK